MKCENCGEEFVYEEVGMDSDVQDMVFNYFRLNVKYCRKCILEAYQMRLPAVFTYYCSKCGAYCDFPDEEYTFDNILCNGLQLEMEIYSNGDLCAECARDLVLGEQAGQEL